MIDTEFYNNLRNRTMKEVAQVHALGEQIGYGHLMCIAHELWARKLEQDGIPRNGAFCVVPYFDIEQNKADEYLNDKIYTKIIKEYFNSKGA